MDIRFDPIDSIADDRSRIEIECFLLTRAHILAFPSIMNYDLPSPQSYILVHVKTAIPLWSNSDIIVLV